MKLEDGVQNLKGVGPKREAALAVCGIKTVGDLLWLLPSAYQDRSRRRSLREISDTPVTIEASVVKKGTILRINSKLSLFVLPIEERDDDGHIVRGEAVWFNQPWLQNHFLPEEICLFYGKVRQKGEKHQILTPQFALKKDSGNFLRITPIYTKIEGIPPEWLKKTIGQVLNQNPMIPDDMPESLRTAYGLLPMDRVFQNLHCPKKQKDIDAARYRLKFEEGLKINIGILSEGYPRRMTKIRIHNFSQLKRFESGLPFSLTSGQIKVLEDILRDLRENKLMNRLILGDVGSGKTIIAVACAFLFALSGYQTAFMAPTEILAEQHAANFEKMLSKYGIETARLTGSMKKADRETVLQKIAQGEIQVIIGTHALIQDAVRYYHLGLIITDEQHRFGVRQRGRLALKGEQPHTLVMSATPIPRTLSLVFYGDLDVSVIDVLPAGRKKIRTYFYGEKALPKIYAFIEKEIQKGFQAMVVCPFIENSEETDGVRDVGSVYAEIQQFYGGRCTVACLHGKMPTDDKQQIISDFYGKKTQILVATSIIEVGIDVRDVSVMVIMSADRFGLSQLHQLRGRAGRGSQQSHCFLVSNVRNEKTMARMSVIVNHQSGQEIAEEDYRLRGPGDYFGSRQHGLPSFKALDPYTDLDLLAETRKAAEDLLVSKQADRMCYRSKLLEAFINDTEITMN